MKGASVLILRADGNAGIGMGHVMRCLALGQAWREAGGEVHFITASRAERILGRLAKEGFSVHTLKNVHPGGEDRNLTESFLERYPGAWLVLDGYHFDGEYQRAMRAAGERLLVIDDLGHLPSYHARILLNQNVHAAEVSYACPAGTRILRGPRYALLRREFLRWKDWRREIAGTARRILVTLGGGDPENATGKVLEALRRLDLPGLEVAVVMGAANPNREEIERKMAGHGPGFRLFTAVEDMARWMAWADLAVSAAGSTAWEAAFLGLPSLVLILAENQRPVAERLSREGVLENLGRAESVSPAQIAAAAGSLAVDRGKRAEMSARGRQLVDGLGAGRVTGEMRG